MIGLGFKERSCGAKRKMSAKQARLASRALRLQPYRCEFCRRWHVGHISA